MPPPPAPALTRVIIERGLPAAEVWIMLDSGDVERVSGPSRRNRNEALKDCLELRKVAVKCARGSSLFTLRQKVKELQDVVWTMKDLGGRLLEGAEGPPPGFSVPKGLESVLSSNKRPTTPAPTPAATRTPGSARAAAARIVKGQGPPPECIIEVADIWEAAMLGGSTVTGDWESKAEVMLRKACGRFGSVLEVKANARSEEGAPIATVRFSAPKGAEACMQKSQLGFLQLQSGGCSVRVRQPAAKEGIWARFPRPSSTTAAPLSGPSAAGERKRMRPNERFRASAAEAPVDDSEAFWEKSKDSRGTAAEPPPNTAPPPQEAPPEPEPVAPEKPVPAEVPTDGSLEDVEVAQGEQRVAKSMADLLDAPFSQRRKLLKKLRVEWHPDKNAEDRQTIATRVFQFIQAHDEWLAFHEIS